MIFLKYKLNRLRRQSAPDAAFKAALRSRLVINEPVVIARSPFVPVMRYAFATMALVLVVVLGTSSYAYASSSVTEGDTLYPVKTALEDVEGSLKKSPEARARFQAKLMERRTHELAYRLRHNQALSPQAVQSLSQVMNVSVEELKNLQEDEAGRQLDKTELKLEMVNTLTKFRARVELSNLPEAQKAKYLNAIDARLDALARITTSAPLE